MKKFARLISEIDATTKTNQKIKAIEMYFGQAEEQDKLWALALFTGRRPRRVVSPAQMRQWVSEASGIPLWLVEESYHVVGDLAETISMLMPDFENEKDYSLSHYIEIVKSLSLKSDEERKEIIISTWKSLTRHERFVFNKIITGGFRVGVSQNLVVKALSADIKLEAALVTHKITGNWTPETTTFAELLLTEDFSSNLSQPYPFYLAYPLEEIPESLGEISLWQAEWKWDGIRGQIIKRKGELFIWTRGEELVTEKFPEFEKIRETLPDGIVIDGEILGFKNNAPLPFNLLQKRIGRKKITPAILTEAPVALIAYDLLEYQGKDIRNKPLSERRKILEEIVDSIPGEGIILVSEILKPGSWEELNGCRMRAREHSSEGLMLKKLDSVYETGRKRGNWWKWKLDPHTIDAVLIYAQRGHGRRANLYTDYTFAVWDNDLLVPFAKAYSGLTDKEIAEVDAFVKNHTREKFGPVRSVEPKLVFEIAFEGINPSPRHKSGVALRFPRIHRWRRDKNPEDADSLENLRKLL